MLLSTCPVCSLQVRQTIVLHKALGLMKNSLHEFTKWVNHPSNKDTQIIWITRGKKKKNDKDIKVKGEIMSFLPVQQGYSPPPRVDPHKPKVHLVCPLTVGHTDTGHRNMPVPLFLFGLQWPQDNKQTHTCNRPRKGWRKKTLQKCHQTVQFYFITRGRGADQGEGEEERSWRERDVSNSSSSLGHTGDLGAAASFSIMYWFS